MEKYKPMWEVRGEPGETLQIYIYGDVERLKYDWTTDEVVQSQNSAEHFKELLTANPNAKRIELYINSYGGSVFEGTAIYSQLRRHPAEKIVYVDGFACSIASVIAMAGNRVIMPRNTMMMVHNMWMGVIGNAAELRKAADDLDTINAAGRAAYLEKAGDKLNEEELIRMMNAETWLTAEDCIRLGLADEYAEKDADMSGASEMLQRANAGIQARVAEHKALAAQLREIVSGENVLYVDNAPVEVKEKATEPEEPDEPEEGPRGAEEKPGEAPEEKQGETPDEAESNKNMLAALFAGQMQEGNP